MGEGGVWVMNGVNDTADRERSPLHITVNSKVYRSLSVLIKEERRGKKEERNRIR